MNWSVIIVVGIAAIILIIFLVWRNQKDEKEFEQAVNNDYRKPTAEETDIETDDMPKWGYRSMFWCMILC